jgi:phage terminase large subunit
MNNKPANATIVFNQNYASTAQVVVNQGGTNSGKTYAIEQVLFCLACLTPNQVITVVGQDIPNLKAGALRDAMAILHSSDLINSMIKKHNKTERIFEFHNGSSGYTKPHQ